MRFLWIALFMNCAIADEVSLRLGGKDIAA